MWSHAGILCTGETYKAVVKLTFAKGASLKDPSRLFNASLEGNTRRAIDIHEGDTLDETALTALIRGAGYSSVFCRQGPVGSDEASGVTAAPAVPGGQRVTRPCSIASRIRSASDLSTLALARRRRRSSLARAARRRSSSPSCQPFLGGVAIATDNRGPVHWFTPGETFGRKLASLLLFGNRRVEEVHMIKWAEMRSAA